MSEIEQDEELFVWDESDLGASVADEGRAKAELISELNGLRSRIQILRAERTAMAGKKYALEVMLEGTQAKVDAMHELLATSQEPPQAQLEQIKELVHQARMVAEGRGSSGDGLEAERLAQLKALNTLETKYGELKERAAGYRTERDALRQQAGAVEREFREREEQLVEKLQTLGEQGKRAIAARDAAIEAQRAAEAQAEEARAEFEELAAQASAEDRERAERLQAVLAQAAQDATLMERAAKALRSRASGLREALSEVELGED